ncbi:MAG: hypothetical protein IRY99_14235 [Isosphaeraceae bacterium]|nr:hypothetical protein [Isosphaeraceae bacterium]
MSHTMPSWAACIFVVLAALAFVGGCGPPQIGADREAFKAVDALYTAVSLRDPQQLGRCEQALRDLHAAGKLPEAAHQRLEAIIAQARGGQWENAQGRLGEFMRGQRR